jgi:hypothetical protein
MTFHERGITSSVSVMSSPSLEAAAAAGRAGTGGGHDDALARQVIGERLAARALALERGDGGVFAARPRRRAHPRWHRPRDLRAAAPSVPAGACCVRRWRRRLALQLGDLQLEMGDHRLGGALAGLCVGEPRLCLIGSAGRRVQQRLERFDVVRKGRNGGFHDHE